MVREAPKQPPPKDEWADDDDDINTGLWSLSRINLSI